MEESTYKRSYSPEFKKNESKKNSQNIVRFDSDDEDSH